MVWIFGSKVNEQGNCKPLGSGSTNEQGLSTVRTEESGLGRVLAAENVATVRMPPAMAGSARSNVEM